LLEPKANFVVMATRIKMDEMKANDASRGGAFR
jgi:hypothetical protein